MNNINQLQNEKKFIEYLKAQRVAYSQCKTYQILDIISVVISITLPLIGIYKSELVNVFGAIGVVWTIVYLVAESFRKSKAKQGAKIQEQFDTELYGLPWNEVLCKTKINRDLQTELSSKYKGNDLKDWYSKEIGSELPQEVAILLCQRINFSWELNLRKKYVSFLIISIVFYYGIFLFVAALENTGLYDILILLAPSISFLIYGVQNISALRSHIKSKHDALNLIDSKLEEYKSNKIIPKTDELRQVQDLIYTERIVPEKIPDWFYKTFRTKNETRIDDLIKTIKNEL